MKQKILTLTLLSISLLLFTSLANALVVNSANAESVAPGAQGEIRLELENTFNDDVEDVSLQLQLENLPFIPIGSSEQSVEEIKNDDDETFIFILKAAPEAAPGDYEIPYTISYRFQNEVQPRIKTGSLGMRVVANPQLTFSISAEVPVVDTQSRMTLRITNKGFSDARFVSVRLLEEDYALLSDSEVYIGTVDSDDFENADFEVIFTKENPAVRAIVEYTDFENRKKIEEIELPLTVYTQERAIELGIIKKSQTAFYVGIVIAVILLIIFWRAFRRRQRMKRSMRNSNGGN